MITHTVQQEVSSLPSLATPPHHLLIFFFLFLFFSTLHWVFFPPFFKENINSPSPTSVIERVQTAHWMGKKLCPINLGQTYLIGIDHIHTLSRFFFGFFFLHLYYRTGCITCAGPLFMPFQGPSTPSHNIRPITLLSAFMRRINFCRLTLTSLSLFLGLPTAATHIRPHLLSGCSGVLVRENERKRHHTNKVRTVIAAPSCSAGSPPRPVVASLP